VLTYCVAINLTCDTFIVAS